jgi:hypothetical protein
MTETRIRWEDGPYAVNQLGYAGPREDWLFCIFKATDDPADDTHALMSLLPGCLGDYPRSDDPADLKRAAEDRLAGFVSSLGAIFTGSLRADLKAERDAQDEIASGQADLGHAEEAARSYGRVAALDGMLATIDRTTAATAGEGVGDACE